MREAAVVDDAVVGESLAAVAERAGVESIPYGCHTGSCGVCEVELRRYAAEGPGGEGEGGDPAVVVVRACVAVVPAGASRVEIDLMDDGGVWGQDGWDT
jgi:ferredoxin